MCAAESISTVDAILPFVRILLQDYVSKSVFFAPLILGISSYMLQLNVFTLTLFKLTLEIAFGH